MTAEGALTLRLRPPAGAGTPGEPRLLLVLRPKKGEPETVTHTLALERDGAHWRAELGPEPVLDEGRWDVYARVGAEGARQRVLPGVRDLRALPERELPGPGARGPLALRLPYDTKDGYLAIRAWVRPAHAEAGRIEVAEDSMTVTGRLVGAEPGPGAAALLKRRGKGGPLRQLALRDEGAGAFSFTADYGLLVEDSAEEADAADPEGQGPAAGGEPVFWDVFVRPAEGATRIRVGRLFDDVADKKPVFVFPERTAGPRTVRPYYTVDNDLSLRVAG
ncbi:hypothetical protein D7294_18510 [Streptomyces hoynatensis]|uniref:Transferase n=2 Tax=Streptomyces hoynatensis TaxID=1141874 RepID=A0A3A9YWR5_9ACTN|nr:hypothetical protein D7294_18510 [Streptomyces hoynatensis]